jgi:hypothetical protein
MEVVQEDDKSVYRAITGEPSGWNGHVSYTTRTATAGFCSRIRETRFERVRRLLAFLHLDGDVNLRVGLLVLPETHHVALRVLKVRERTHTWNRLPRADDAASAGLHFPEGVVDRVNVDRDHRRGRV